MGLCPGKWGQLIYIRCSSIVASPFVALEITSFCVAKELLTNLVLFFIIEVKPLKSRSLYKIGLITELTGRRMTEKSGYQGFASINPPKWSKQTATNGIQVTKSVKIIKPTFIWSFLFLLLSCLLAVIPEVDALVLKKMAMYERDMIKKQSTIMKRTDIVNPFWGSFSVTKYLKTHTPLLP